jgi:hypothetical protein
MFGNATVRSMRGLIPLRLCLVAGMALGLTQCDRERGPEPADAEPIVDTPAPAPEITGPATLDRAAFLGAISRAGSAYAADAAAPGPDGLVGRTFAIRVPFGCGRPRPAVPIDALPALDEADAGLPTLTWGTDNAVLNLSLTPDDWADTALIAGSGAADRWEAVEGFWVTRPWLGSETCPQISRDPLQGGSNQPSAQTVGLASVHATNGSRLTRRDGQAYRFTLRGDDDRAPVPSPMGYRVVLEGRFASFPDGRAIRCRAASIDQRPICIAAVHLDRVAFEDGSSGAVLSEWRPG